VSTLPLFLVCVLVWGTTWYAIVWQLEALSPAAAVALRFALAAAALFAWCLLRRVPCRYARPVHALFAGQGLLGFALSYLCVYAAEQRVVSGLVAVGYAASPLVNMALARLLLQTPLSQRVGVGGIAGLTGVLLIFWPELARLRGDEGVAWGAGMTAAGVGLSALANICVARYQRQSIGGAAPLAWAMAYGAAGMAAWTVCAGTPWHLGPLGTRFWLSLVYLVLAGSVLTFLCFNLLMARVGPARASYVGVATPVIALAISTVLEGFQPTALTGLGVLLVVSGNLCALWPTRAGEALSPARA
jgi:drug/metabolite transporter (DMT)-like permease